MLVVDSSAVCRRKVASWIGGAINKLKTTYRPSRITTELAGSDAEEGGGGRGGRDAVSRMKLDAVEEDAADTEAGFRCSSGISSCRADQTTFVCITHFDVFTGFLSSCLLRPVCLSPPFLPLSLPLSLSPSLFSLSLSLPVAESISLSFVPTLAWWNQPLQFDVCSLSFTILNT